MPHLRVGTFGVENHPGLSLDTSGSGYAHADVRLRPISTVCHAPAHARLVHDVPRRRPGRALGRELGARRLTATEAERRERA